MLSNFLKAKITNLSDNIANVGQCLSIGLILMAIAMGCVLGVIWVLAMSLFRLPMMMVRRGTKWVKEKPQQ